MNCPNCGTYNPDERDVCWRCDKPLPKRKEVKKRDPQKSAQMWLYVAIAVFFLISIAQACGVKLPFGPQTPAEPSGYVPLRPAIVRQVDIDWLV